jgi:hypothetical protein
VTNPGKPVLLFVALQIEKAALRDQEENSG